MLLSLLQGCSILPGLHVDADVGDRTPEYEVVEINADTIRQTRLGLTPPAEQPPAVRDAFREYRIGPGDVLSVIVWDHPELTNPTGEFRDPVSSGRLVGADGKMFYPYTGTTQVSGLTVLEVQERITRSLARVINNPQVEVRVAAFRSQRVQVTGEVRQPGLVTLDDTSKGVLEAISERGGLTPEASRREALLVRGDTIHPIDLSGLLAGGRPAPNLELSPGDIVHVPDASADQVFVVGEVTRQQTVRMSQRSVSLMHALTEAGGLDQSRAEDNGVLVFRRASAADSTSARIFALDLSEPQGVLLAGEFELAPRDVVYVKATGFSRYNSVIGQLLPTISAVFQLDRLIND